MILKKPLLRGFSVGSNLAGDKACADWRFLLPSLEIETVLVLGQPALATLAMLQTICQRLYVVSDSGPNQPEKQTSEAPEMVRLNLQVPIEIAENSVGLIYLYQSSLVGEIQELAEELVRVLAPTGLVYVERQGRFDSGIRRLRGHCGWKTAGEFWITPLTGSLRTAVAVEEPLISDYFFANVLYGQSQVNRALSWLGRKLSRLGLLDRIMPRKGYFLRPTDHSDELQIPTYLRELALANKLNFSRYRIGFSARGKYNSNKVIFFLFDRSEAQPRVVVKMTRAPEYNYRLQNEFEALRRLSQSEILPGDAFPAPLFYAEHNGQGLLAMNAVAGIPFRSATTARPDCPRAAGVINLLTRLGERTALPAASGQRVAETMDRLLQEFSGIFGLDATERRMLCDQIDILARCGNRLPTVFQHGDPGTWNILIAPNGRAIIIDWESGESDGVPLWDLFYFLKTFGSWLGRMAGQRNSSVTFREQFLADSPMRDLLRTSLRRYLEVISVVPEAAEPLFYFCWLHRALKEASRRRHDNLQQAQYCQILRSCLVHRKEVNELLDVGRWKADMVSSHRTSALRPHVG